jgi:hypothetical protein
VSNRATQLPSEFPDTLDHVLNSAADGVVFCGESLLRATAHTPDIVTVPPGFHPHQLAHSWKCAGWVRIPRLAGRYVKE